MTLTPREREVVHLLGDGKSDGDIAMLLAISRRTVRFHVENAKRSLGAETRCHLMKLALEEVAAEHSATNREDL